MNRKVLAASALVLGLSLASPGATLAETGEGRGYREAGSYSGEFQLASLTKPKKKKRA